MFENALRIIQVILKSMKTLYFLIRMQGLMYHNKNKFWANSACNSYTLNYMETPPVLFFA